MKHCILSKFKKEYRNDVEEMLPDIRNIFDPLLNIEGITKIDYITNCIDRDNRYDLLIMITMDKETLDTYDHSAEHKKWKENYGDRLEAKAIFDFE